MVRNSQSGFTLVELMIVIIIIGILFGWLAQGIVGGGDKAKAQITKVKIKELGSKIEVYQLQYNSLPSSLEDLTRCTERTGADCVPITNTESLKDAWNNNFLYTLENGGRTYRIKSLGADGKDGGEGVDYDTFGTGP